jgi:hypothetical protein
MAAIAQPGGVGVAERLPHSPGSQNETPLSSARAIGGKSKASAVAARVALSRRRKKLGLTGNVWGFIGCLRQSHDAIHFPGTQN